MSGEGASAARPLRVLLVEDSAEDATLVLGELRRRGYAPDWQRVDSAAGLQRALAEGPWDCVLSDFELPGFGGLAALRLVQTHGLDVPFIVISGRIGEETAVGAMKAGAHDYVMKHTLSRLCPALERELREAESRRERRRVAAALAEDAVVTAALQRVGQTLITALASPTLLSALCEVTAEVLGCDSSHTLLYQADAGVFRPIADFGASAEEQATARAVALPRALLVDLLERLAEDDVSETRAPAAVGVPAVGGRQLCIALRCGAELIGIQVARRRDPLQPFDGCRLRIGRGIAQLASMTPEHARVRRELEQSNRLKSDFVDTMSHELRTPLNIIMGYTELLLDGSFGGVPEEQRQALQRVDRSARALLELVDAMLDLGRLERGPAPVDVEWIDAGEFVRNLLPRVDRVRPRVRLLAEVANRLPPLRTDPLKLRVILLNLIANALKFTETGSVTVHVRAADDAIAFAVADTGSGIDPDVLPTIFEPFRQGHSGATPIGGVGLGLYIVHKLLDLLLGTIEVESTPGRGSTFRITLPRDLTAPAARRAAAGWEALHK